MADPTTPAIRTPWHLWLVGVLAVLWNSVGAFDFTMTATKNAGYLSVIPPKQLEYINGLPSWVMIAWGIAVWSGVLGSLLLLFRKCAAVSVFVASLVCLILTDINTYLLSNGGEVMGGIGAKIFAAVIFVVAVLLLLYARGMRRCGVLR